MTITNGTIEFNRRVKTGDYEHKDAKVSLSFTVPDGGDAHKIAEHVASVAKHHAHRLVDETAPHPTSTPLTAAGSGTIAAPMAVSSAPMAGVSASLLAGPGPTATTAASPSSGPTSLPGAGTPTAPNPGLPGSPAPVAASPLPGASLPGSAPATVAPAVAENRPVLVQNDPTVVAALPWDDKTVVEHLTHAAQRMAPTHGEHTGPNIMALIASFIPAGTPMPAGPKCGLIPVEHRQAFLDRLAAL